MTPADRKTKRAAGGGTDARRALLGVLASICLVQNAMAQASGNRDATGAVAAAEAADAGFEERCKAEGVIQCLGFDDAGLHGARQGVARVDRNVKLSGGGSMHVAVAPNAGMAPGNVVVPLGASFGEGSSLYIQWRQRFSPSMVDDDLGGNGMKQIVLYDDQPCCEVEVAMLNEKYRGFPAFYTNVMRNWMYRNLPGGDVAYQFDDKDAYCTEKDMSRCDKYHPDEWMTFYYEQHIGKWGQPNSIIKAYWAREGRPLKQYVHITDWTFRQDRPGAENAFRTVWIGPFSVDRTAGNNLPAAETWYDEFIVSTRPIADPNRGPSTILRLPGADNGLKQDTRSRPTAPFVALTFRNIRPGPGISLHDMQGRRLNPLAGVPGRNRNLALIAIRPAGPASPDAPAAAADPSP